MDRYWVTRGGSVGNWGAYYVIDRQHAKNIAMVDDPEMAQRIADLMNLGPVNEEMVRDMQLIEDARNGLIT